MPSIRPALILEFIEYKDVKLLLCGRSPGVASNTLGATQARFLKNLNLHAFSRSFSTTLPKMVRDEQFTNAKLLGYRQSSCEPESSCTGSEWTSGGWRRRFDSVPGHHHYLIHLKIKNYIFVWLRATHQHISWSGFLERFGDVTNGSTDQTSHAHMAHPCPA